MALAQRVEASQNHLRVATRERAFLLERLLEHQASGVQPKLPNRRKEKRSARRKEQIAAVSAGGHAGGRSAHGKYMRGVRVVGVSFQPLPFLSHSPSSATPLPQPLPHLQPLPFP